MSGQELMLWWEARDASQGQDAEQLARFMNGLSKLDPTYASWLEPPSKKMPAISCPISTEQARSALNDHIFQFRDGPLKPNLGSWLTLANAGPPPYNLNRDNVALTEMCVGAYGKTPSFVPNHIFMRLAQKRSLTGRPWHASELRPLMIFARDTWRPARMCAKFSFYRCPKIADPTWAAGERTLFPWIGWITYLPPDLAARAKYPADVEIETLDDGAALVTLCEEPFDKDDAQGLARLHALEAALRPIQS